MPTTPEDLLLLDTHVWIWVVEGVDGSLGTRARSRIERAARRGRLRVAVISAWEVALLASRDRIRLSLDIGAWVARALRAPGLRPAALTPRIAVESVGLLDFPSQDPADRMIAATARALGATLVTADRELLAYAERGHLAALDAAAESV